MEALNAGAVDLTGGSSTSYITSRAGGVKLVMFAYQLQSAGNECIVVRSDSSLHGLADLQDHIVAVNRGGTGEYLLVRALTKANIPVDTVKRAYLAPPDASSALNDGHVDAWATWDPFLSVALQNGSARLLIDGAQAGSENAIAFFVSQNFLQAHRAVVAAVFNVLRAENAWGARTSKKPGRSGPRNLACRSPLPPGWANSTPVPSVRSAQPKPSISNTSPAGMSQTTLSLCGRRSPPFSLTSAGSKGRTTGSQVPGKPPHSAARRSFDD